MPRLRTALDETIEPIFRGKALFFSFKLTSLRMAEHPLLCNLYSGDRFVIMSFRRDKMKALRWQNWLRKHREKVLACGVPPMVLEDISHWYYFLDHGDFTPVGSTDPIILVDYMNKADAERLCSFLEQDEDYPNSSTLNRLQFLLKRGPHAPSAD